MAHKTTEKTGLQYNILLWALFIAVMATTTFSLLTSSKLIHQHTQLIDAAMEIKLETTLSHLWLEEVISGDKSESLAKAWGHLDKANWYAQAMLKGDESPTGVFTPLNSPELHAEILKVISKIVTFRSIAETRSTAMEQSGVGSLSDQRFDAVFMDLLQQADHMEMVLKTVQQQDVRRFKATQILLIVVCLTLSVLSGIAVIRYERHKKQHARERQESEHRFSTFFRSINDAIFVYPLKDGAPTPFTEVNQVATSRYEYTREELLQLSLSDLTKQDQNNQELTLEQQLKRHNTKHFIYESIHLSKSGLEIPVEINANIIELEDGEPLVLSVVRDISERKRAEVRLAMEKERLAVTLHSIGDGVIATDINGRVVFLNKVAEDLSGWTTEDARGELSTKVFNIINEKTGEKCVSPVQRVIELGRIIGLANHTALIAKDGSIHSIADSGAPIRDQDSKIIGVVIVFRDVTQEKRMAEELLKIKKLESVGVLAGGIAHDFNNILSAILGNIELASYRIAGDDRETASLLANATQATKRATKLTAQLLTFSKGGEPIKEETSLPELIRESADFVTHGSKTMCNYTFQDQLWDVDVDRGQISQVIQNIILNARHALPEGGTINIDCANVQDAASEALLSVDNGNYVRITIQDSGVGIPRGILDKIFDPYFTTKQQGSGLGLAICHSIINKHDGHIIVDSIPGKGSTFIVYLPAVIQQSDTQARPDEQTSPAVKAARVMLMDDEEMIRTLVKSQLANLGHEAILTTDGEQAINKYQELQDSGNPVDLVIMDLTIPGGMGGQEAAQKLLTIDPNAKIIVASGYSNDHIMAHFQDYGFCAAVAKPFDLKELSQVISTALQGQ